MRQIAKPSPDKILQPNFAAQKGFDKERRFVYF